jgi:glycosyltransferase involved in cell wall biosynthesis
MSGQTSKRKRIIHLSSVHRDRDVRIFLKECRSLAKLFPECEVHLILAGVEERCEENVHIHSIPKVEGSRLKRMWTTVNHAYRKAKELDGDIYHLHDPELMRIALKLKRKGKKVIYDAHEDLPRQILGKSYLPMKKIVSVVMERVENFICARLSGIITATPHIAKRFEKINKLTVAINNFPLENEIEFIGESSLTKENTVCFIGGISPIRGTKELVDAMALTNCNLALAGEIPSDFKAQLTESNGWKNVEELGFIDRERSMIIKQKSIAGMVTFLPYPNHINAQPNKIFEYMAAGLPVIGSNFPMWRELLVDNYCGICVDPTKPKEIAEAINYLINHPEEAEIMGSNGKKLVTQTYNWNAEEVKLAAFYRSLA